MVVMCAWISEQAITGLLLASRFSIAFYAIRFYSLITSIVVLAVLLEETTRLYARHARSNLALRRERNNKLMNMEAMAASIAHQVRQPLMGITASGSAALRFLEHSPPNIEKAGLALNRIVAASLRASEIFDDVRALFAIGDQRPEPIDVNVMLLGALRTLREELDVHGITTNTELTSELPLAMGHRGQLQEVILNLVRNSIEAMATINDGSRVLRLSTELIGHDIGVVVEDSGPGINPEKLDDVFDPFVTTKPNGMGLGLAICRMIIDRHGGTLLTRSGKKGSGALFQFVLPINSASRAELAPS
jgi:signal transduction histidine kinase